jgi:hypothetical protein
MGRRRLAALAAAALLAFVAIWWIRARSLEAQVPACFAALAEALADNDAGAVVACLHPDYGFARQWPEVWERRESLRGLLRAGEEADSDRGLARAGLKRLLALHALNRLELAWKVASWRELGDGTVEVRADFGLDAPNGSICAIRPPLQGHRFVLARYGIAARLRILAHDPLPVRPPVLP